MKVTTYWHIYVNGVKQKRIITADFPVFCIDVLVWQLLQLT